MRYTVNLRIYDNNARTPIVKEQFSTNKLSLLIQLLRMTSDKIMRLRKMTEESK